MTPEARPFLECPECDAPLVLAWGRGRIDRDGNEILHRETCRCRWCRWWWRADQDPVTCACGYVGRVDADEGHAFLVDARKGAT